MDRSARMVAWVQRGRDLGRKPPRRQAGFTIIELLIVVAVIGILAAIVIPNLRRAYLKSRVTRLAADASTVRKGFMQYYADLSYYPSTTTPADRAFNRATLDPLTRLGYIKSGHPIVDQLQDSEVTSYDSPNVGGSDSQYWAVLTLNVYPAVQVVIADTTEFPGFEGTTIDGGFFFTGGRLYPLDQDILKILGR